MEAMRADLDMAPTADGGNQAKGKSQKRTKA
jgi:hypothetical protein